jgi:hypothetical protein
MSSLLSEADFNIIRNTARDVWDTQRQALSNPTATILRYTEYPNPEILTATTITHSRLSINEDLVGRQVNLVEGSLDTNYIITGYTATSITVATADFITDGFTLASTFHVEGIDYRQRLSPTIVQVLSVGTETLINRPVAYYNLTEKELRQFNNELNVFDKKFVFFDINIANDDRIILDGQEYAIHKTKNNTIYNMMVVFGKALRQQ